MNKINEFLEKYFLPLAMKISGNIYLQAIRDGLTLTMPLLIVGSIFLIFAYLPIPGYSGFMEGVFGELWKSRILYPVQVTYDVMAMVASIGVAYRLAEKKRVDPISCGVISLTAFLLLSPFSILHTIGETAVTVTGINLGLVGSKGLFVAIIVGIYTTEVVKFTIDKNLIIKMPDSVPPAVGKSFLALIPAIITIILTLVVRIGFELTSFENVHNFITIILGKPLTILGGSFIGTILSVLAAQIFWSMGLHGATIVGSVMTPIWLQMMDENRLAFQMGAEIPNITTSSFMFMSFQYGGSGLTLSLVFLMTFFAKSKQLREIGKISLGPGIFNINEPVIFGTPIVMNPILLVPFILAPLVNTTILYWGTKFGLIGITTGVNIPWTIPAPIHAYLVSGGNLSTVFGVLVSLIVTTLIYYPFFKMYDEQKYQEEIQGE
ncbi:PTS cellobiose transporter subunit IIC [Fusobacterium sp.]|uniref:PTS cellobiose transporter subunit IIC n=1 Tax=Fusobacterium sp. TaxID=68766 RepID=UPI002611CB52|nr:PTS cellobiose transporter subunit IIC [Fusobacterium sp.]